MECKRISGVAEEELIVLPGSDGYNANWRL